MIQLENVDDRLEERLTELYNSHKERAKHIDWSYHEFIPWGKARCFKEEPWDEAKELCLLRYIQQLKPLY